MLVNKVACERYTLILKHEYLDGELTYELDEPIIMRRVSPVGTVDGMLDCMNRGIVLNHMMDEFKKELLETITMK